MRHVVVVEDERMVRQGIVSAVDWASVGFAVAGEAADGREGLEVIRACRPDLVVTDIRMPRMDGIEMVQTLREEGNQVAVIFLTAYGEFDYAQSAVKLGAADYLLKPFHDGELENAVRALLARTAEPLPAREEAPEGVSQNRHIREAARYIAAHCADQELGVAALARQLGLSESRLSHLFRQETGSTVSAYITAYRMERAKELLSVYPSRIGDVAEQVGYRDVTYFSTAFRKNVGMPPSEYQRSKQ